MYITDQTGYSFLLGKPPRRIVCLVPSITAFLCNIGLKEQLCGVTKFCIHPADIRHKATVVGGTKNYSIEKIRALRPDIVIANKEENVRGSILELRRHLPVYVTDIYTLNDALDMMRRMGTLFDREKETQSLVSETEQVFATYAPAGKRLRTAYLIWRNPYMTIGRETFIHDVLDRLGFENVFASAPGRYPEISAGDLEQAGPELVLLSSEPYPFGEKHVAEFREILPEATILPVDGECFSWYGSAVKEAPLYARTHIRNILEQKIH